MPESTARTIVLALGNPLRGDDGIGRAVLDDLISSCLPDDVTALDGGTPGLETVLLLQGYQCAIIVDAADMGLEPGTWRRFTVSEAKLATNGLWGTLHQAGLADALALGDALGVLPDEIVVYGVQPAVIGWEPGLSAPVQAAIPAVCAAIQNQLQNEVEAHA